MAFEDNQALVATCEFCETTYKLLSDTDVEEAIFCPFCGEECVEEDDEDDQLELDWEE